MHRGVISQLRPARRTAAGECVSLKFDGLLSHPGGDHLGGVAASVLPAQQAHTCKASREVFGGDAAKAVENPPAESAMEIVEVLNMETAVVQVNSAGRPSLIPRSSTGSVGVYG